MILNIRHHGIPVKDMDSMILWYEILGFRLESLKTEKWYGVNIKVAKFHQGLELVQCRQMDWPAHASFAVSEFPNALDGIESENRNGYEVKFAHDADGNRLEFVKALVPE